MTAGPARQQIVQARRLLEENRLDQAQALLVRFLHKSPADAEANIILQRVGSLRRDMAQAVYYARRAVAAAPRDLDLLENLGNCLVASGAQEEAVVTMSRAAAEHPTDPRVIVPLVGALTNLFRFQEALEHLNRGLAANPDDVDLLCNSGVVLLRIGRAHESVAAWERVIAVDPTHAEAASSLCTTVNYADGIDPAHVFAAHERFGRLLAEACGPPLRAWKVTPDPERRLRVGIISPDLREHSVGYFIEPVFRHHDRSRIEIVCYSCAVREDAVSARFRSMAAAWSNVGALKISDIAQRIVEDRIDVLVDLAALTVGNKIPVMAVKPAPVQFTWIGYPNTTGLRTVDCRIVDSSTDPPGAEAYATERLVRLDPCFLAYTPAAGAPAPAPPPILAAGYTTFGSFGALVKLTDRTVALWSRVLKAAPGSRLVFKAQGLAEHASQEEVHSRLERCGVERARVTLLGPADSTAEHLATYSRIDVALDTYPYHGTTTTCEALWMGVPVVSLIGRTHASRVGLSLLAAAGLAEWAVDSDDHFVEMAARLASDPMRLEKWRSAGPEGLRARLASSPLCDGAALCKRFEGAIREAWRNWCASRGPAARA